VGVVETRTAGGAAAEECAIHVDGHLIIVRLLIATFTLILKTSLMNHIRVDDPRLGQSQVMVRGIYARGACGQRIDAGAGAASAAAAAAAEASAAAAAGAPEAEAEAAAEANREFLVRDFAAVIVVIHVERVVFVNQIINARAGECPDGFA